MDYRSFLLHNPIAWLLAAGFFLGAAAAQLTVVPGRTRDPAKTRRRRPTKIFLLLAAAVPSATTAVILSAPEGPRDPKYLAAAAAGALVGGLGLRFKKTAGVLLLLLAGFIGYGARTALREWTPAYEKTPAAAIKVLHLGETDTTLLVSVPGGNELVLQFPSPDVSIRTEILRFDDLYAFFGRKISFKLTSLRSGGTEHPFGANSAVQSLQEGLLYRLPGVARERAEIAMPAAELFSTYILTVDERGKAEIVKK